MGQILTTAQRKNLLGGGGDAKGAEHLLITSLEPEIFSWFHIGSTYKRIFSCSKTPESPTLRVNYQLTSENDSFPICSEAPQIIQYPYVGEQNLIKGSRERRLRCQRIVDGQYWSIDPPGPLFQIHLMRF